MEDIKNINKPKSLAEKRRAEREAIQAKIKKQQEQKRFFKDAAAELKNVGADKPVVAKAKERLTRLANNPNARIQGTTAISYMANNTPMDALRDIGLIPPAGERCIRVGGKQVSIPRKTSPSRKTTVSDAQKRKQVRTRPANKEKNYNVGVSKGGVSFNTAFAHFRKKGNKTFTWNGKKYTTELASEKKRKK